VGLRLRPADGTACFLEYPEREGEALHEDDEAMALLYRHEKTYAIGHGCAAEWDTDEAGRVTAVRSEGLPRYELLPIVPARLPGLELRMLDLSDRGRDKTLFALLTALCDRYGEWIDRQKAVAGAADFPARHRAAAARHLENCDRCLERMRSEIRLLRESPDVLLAFRLANRAMLEQQLHYMLASESDRKRDWRVAAQPPPPDAAGPGRGQRRGGRATRGRAAAAAARLEIDPPRWPDVKQPPAGKGLWRPFQIGFILMNLRSLAVPGDAERGVVDLIWFPTGGGKTEAYLGLTAFTIFLRRLRDPENAGTAVLMRYTLRLLTTQQFQRAASLICACERIRQEMAERLGDERISIGLWVGNAVTPGDRDDARKALNKLLGGDF
jgi:hypothetical protein